MTDDTSFIQHGNGNFWEIPERLNLALALILTASVVFIWWIPTQFPGRSVLYFSAIGFALVEQPLYSLLHECMHRQLHRSAWINDFVGFVLSAFLPSSFRLIRLVHVGHHFSNRSKRERIEYYGEGESAFFRGALYYGILLGLNWLAFVLQNVFFTLLPNRVIRALKLDTSFGGTLPRITDRELRWIAAEFSLVAFLHWALVAYTSVTLEHYIVFLGANALAYSQLRYIYHYEAGFDVIEGAFDLRTPRWLRLVLLNGSYHLTHHRYPRAPWIYLSKLADPADLKYGFLQKCIAQWKGVRPESSQPLRSGRVIQWNEFRIL